MFGIGEIVCHAISGEVDINTLHPKHWKQKRPRLIAAASFFKHVLSTHTPYQAKASSVISRGDLSPILIASQRALTVVRISLVKNLADAMRPL